MRFDLSDDEWLLDPLMPKARKSARANDRKIVNDILSVAHRDAVARPARNVMGSTPQRTIASNRDNYFPLSASLTVSLRPPMAF